MGKKNKRIYLTQSDFNKQYNKILLKIGLILFVLSLFRVIPSDVFVIMLLVLILEFKLISIYQFKKYCKKNKLPFDFVSIRYCDGTGEAMRFKTPAEYEEFIIDLLAKCNEHDVELERFDKISMFVELELCE
ncbi:hypothetical protein [Methanococcus maripaludis]|uniref:hypothetical protein n=1 Tax=Methanococcus maripaludis TaxID=39152 RepID=UPI000E6AF718|nr:hypothetical protein [Methanococcus maripaludis]